MSIWTRIAEALASIGDSVGAFLQAIASRNPTPPEKSVAFTIGMIGLGAKMAKADGVVTEDEIKAFKQVFHIPDGELSAVARVFNLAKQDVAGYETYARQIAKLTAPLIGACRNSTPHRYSTVTPSLAAIVVSTCKVFSSIVVLQ